MWALTRRRLDGGCEGEARGDPAAPRTSNRAPASSFRNWILEGETASASRQVALAWGCVPLPPRPFPDWVRTLSALPPALLLSWLWGAGVREGGSEERAVPFLRLCWRCLFPFFRVPQLCPSSHIPLPAAPEVPASSPAP